MVIPTDEVGGTRPISSVSRRLVQATRPHPPSCTGNGGRHDVREHPFPHTAIRTTSSLALKVGRYFDRCSQTSDPRRRPARPRPLHDLASCRRAYPSELTLHPIDAPHHWELSREPTARLVTETNNLRRTNSRRDETR